MKIKAVIFDLDGVIVSTDEYHFQAWKRMADEERIFFDRKINERLRGVSRMASLDIILEKAARSYSDSEKLRLAEMKNNYYRELLKKLTPQDILPGVAGLLDELRNRGILMAIGSSSKNTAFILQKIGLSAFFDAVADGTEISKSKPDPEVFLLAAKKLGVPPSQCAVFEDAEAGIDAALAGGMKPVGIAGMAGSPKALLGAETCAGFPVERLLQLE